jgi:uncharacterized membrane protein
MNSSQLDRPISLPFLPRDRLTPERFLAAVERVVQSNDQFTLDDSLNVNVVHVEMPQGAGNGKRRDVVNLDCKIVRDKIVRDTRDKVVKTKSETKDYRIVYTKRRIVNSFDTLPYGF